ncbi:MAG: argininosuccinate lyase [Balneolaceae bacterium]|nr:MAG: argininosuccinate lyase [Balneolaceae bacterium]
MSKLWDSDHDGHRSDAKVKMETFTVGRDYLLDQELVPFDLKASAVHAAALQKAGVLSGEELVSIRASLSELQKLWERGEFVIRIQDEDMHTAIENYLVEMIGETGKKIHTGRSRNDQVLTALRLFEKEKLNEVLGSMRDTALLLLEFAGAHSALPMPGFTHTRKAMLSSVALWAGGYAELLVCQLEASPGIRSLISRSPLGTAAGFGTTFPINRPEEAEELGFDLPFFCSTTAQLSRGWTELQLVQYLQAVTSVISRFASDVILFSGEGFPYFQLHEEITTGSSIMPQKKNPDLAELIRGRHAELCGSSATLQALTSNLTSGYHRDLQLTKEPVILAFRQSLEILDAVRLLITHMKPNPEALRQACTSELFAAEQAYRLVREEGISFREAYRVVKGKSETETALNWDEIMSSYTHLGSPGNPGVKELLNRVALLQF